MWSHLWNMHIYIYIYMNANRTSNQILIVIMASHRMMRPYASLWMYWRHQMETFSALLALCARNSPVTGEFPSQRPVSWSFNVFFDLGLNKRLSKQSRLLVIWDHRAHYDVTVMTFTRIRHGGRWCERKATTHIPFYLSHEFLCIFELTFLYHILDTTK